MTRRVLVLWDIDRTLLYAGEVDQQVYREVFERLTGYGPRFLPERGSGITTPRVVRNFLEVNGVPEERVEATVREALRLLPEHLAKHRDLLAQTGRVMPGAAEALAAVRAEPKFVPTVVTGNLKANASIKLMTFGLDGFLETELGGYASDDDDRPNLVRIAQQRAAERYGCGFSIENTVVIGDSLEDVNTAKLGGGRIIAVASGTTSAETLKEAGVDFLFENLVDTDALVESIVALGG